MLVPLLFLVLLIIMQRDLYRSNLLSWYYLLTWDHNPCETTNSLHHPQFLVSVSDCISDPNATSGVVWHSQLLQSLNADPVISLCFAVIIGLPAATPKEYINSASFALGNFSNGLSSLLVLVLRLISPS